MGFVTLLLLWTISQNGSRQRHLKTRLPLALLNSCMSVFAVMMCLPYKSTTKVVDLLIV